LLVALAAVFLSLCFGSVDVQPLRIPSILLRGGDDTAARVILELRLPRGAMAFAVGGMLALSGALMQVLLRNPLAEPYVLGVSGGAAVFALLAMTAGATGAAVQGGAMTGSLLSIALVFALARAGGQWNPLRVLLTGVVVAAGWAALTALLLVLSPAAQVQGMLFWLMGDLSGARQPFHGLLALLAGLALAWPFARPLNLLALGEQPAAALGVNVAALRLGIYFLASGLTAVAVTLAGGIGFVGLVVPHLVRLVIGSDHRVVLPVSALAGGSLLVIADTMARTLFAPRQLPAGVITALLGVPLFLFLLRRTAARSAA
jgi:iron complex transport system permease protein